LFQELFGVRDIMDGMRGDLQTNDNLLIRINGDRSFQEAFSRLTYSPGVVMAGIGAGEPRYVDSSTGYLPTPVKEHFHDQVE
jgi:hypothetical protein